MVSYMNKILMNPQDDKYRREELGGNYGTYPARNLGLPVNILNYDGYFIVAFPTYKFVSLPLDSILWSRRAISYYE